MPREDSVRVDGAPTAAIVLTHAGIRGTTPLTPFRLVKTVWLFGLVVCSILGIPSCGPGNGACGGARAPVPADMILTNGTFYTMDDRRMVAEAVAIDEGRFLFVGDASSVEEYIGPETTVVDLEGATVLPGLIDGTSRLLTFGRRLESLDLTGTTSLAQVTMRVAEACRQAEPGQWVFAHGWDHTDWDRKEFPSHHDIVGCDANPVFLQRVGNQTYWVNDSAMQRAGISRSSRDPEGGTIQRNEQSEPTGILQGSAMGLIDTVLPTPTAEQRERRCLLAQERYLELGLTGIVSETRDRSELLTIERLADANKIKIRTHLMLSDDDALLDGYLRDGPRIGLHDRHLTVRTIRLKADGGLGARSAALLEDYSDDPGNQGALLTSPERMQQVCERALRNGYQVSTFAIGDKAVRTTLDVYERALAEVPTRDHRFRIEHAQVIAPEDIPRFAELGVVPVMLPAAAVCDMRWAEDRLGPDRLAGAYAWRSLLQSGAELSLAVLMAEGLRPLRSIHAAATRQDQSGWPDGGWLPEQRLTVEEAVWGHTRAAAYSVFEEQYLGSIEPGKLADLTVLTGNIFENPPSEILQFGVKMTIIGGEVVYESTVEPPEVERPSP